MRPGWAPPAPRPCCGGGSPVRLAALRPRQPQWRPTTAVPGLLRLIVGPWGRSYAAPRGAAYEGQIVNSFVEAGAALPPRLIGIKQIEDCCLCVIEAAGHLGINTPIAPGGVEVMVPDPSPWLRSWISAYPLGSRLFAYSPSPREASGQIIKSSGFERVHHRLARRSRHLIKSSRFEQIVLPIA